MAQTNGGGTKADIITEVISFARKASDMDSIQKMEQLSRKAENPAVKKEISAIYESLILEIQGIYEQRLDEILAENNPLYSADSSTNSPE